MKKFLSLLTAGSMAFSLTAVTLAEETSTDTTSTTTSTTDVSNEACEAKDGAAKVKCLRDRKALQIKLKIRKSKSTTTEEAVQTTDDTGNYRNATGKRITRRTLEDQARAKWKKNVKSILKEKAIKSGTGSTK